MNAQDQYPGAVAPDQTTLTEEQEALAGRTIAYDLKLKRDKEHKDRWVTNWGTKTDLGLWRTVVRMVSDLQAGK